MECVMINKCFLALKAVASNEKEPKDYGCHEPLYHGEISFLESVFANPGFSCAQLAKALGVTKGAISQWGNKLEEKGLLERHYKQGSKKEKHYILTCLGHQVREEHRRYHQRANREMCHYLQALTDEERAAIAGFLDKLATLPISEYECTSPCLFE